MLDLCAVHDTFTTRLHDSQSKFMVIESAVTALLSDDIQLDKSGRRWLDDDEYLVRERIHAAVQHESVEYVSRKVAKTQRV